MGRVLFFLSLFLMGWPSSASGQIISDISGNFEISYVNPDELKACTSSDTLSLVIENTSGSNFDPMSEVTVDFPAGISVVGFVSTNYSFASFDAATNSYTYQNVFGHSNSAAYPLDLILQVDCEIFDLLDNTGGNALDISNVISFDYAISSTPFSYADSTISFNIAQANVKTTVPLYNQTITLPNDFDSFNQQVRYDVVGNSFLDEFILKFTVPSELVFNQIDSIKVNGTVVSGFNNPTLVGGSQYEGVLSASDVGLTNFNTGDLIEVWYNFSPSCLTTVQIDYWTGVPCHSDTCDFDNDLGFVNLIQNPPSYIINCTNDTLADYCGGVSQFTYTIINTDTSGYTMYDPYIYNQFYDGNTWSNIQVNGQAVTAGLPAGSTGPAYFYLDNMQTSGGYILGDYNGDGVYGEIAPGDTIILTFELNLNTALLSNCPADITGNQMYTQFRYYETSCVSSPLQLTPSKQISYSNYNNSSPTISITSGALVDGTSQVIEFCIDRYISEFATGGLSQILLDDELLTGIDISLPCGLTNDNPTAATWVPESGSPITVAVSTAVGSDGEEISFLSGVGELPIISNKIEGCLVINTTFNCDTCSSPSVIAFNAHGEFEKCDTEHQWACESLVICTNCDTVPDCADSGRILHSEFTLNRTNFGWTSSTMTTKVTQAMVDASPLSYNTLGAYGCDTLKMTLNGQVCGGVDDFVPYLTYQKPAGLSSALLDVSSTNLLINGLSTAVGVSAQIDSSGFWVIRFDTISGPFADGTTIEMEVEFVVNKAQINSSPMPNHLISGMTAAFYTNTQWVNGAPPVSPDTLSFFDLREEACLYPVLNFNFYKLKRYVWEPNYSVSCGTNTNILLFRLGCLGGTSGDDFPNEFRPFSILKDSMVLSLTNPLTIGVVDIINASVNSTPLNITELAGEFTLIPSSGVWPVIDKTNLLTYYSVNIGFEVDCGLSDPISLKKEYVHFDEYIYSDDDACIEEDSLTSTSLHNVSNPDVDFLFLNPVQDAVSPAADFDFNVNNNSSFSAEYPWMLITYDPLLVNVSVSGLTSYAWSANQIYVEIGSIPAYASVSEMINISPIFCDVEQVTEVIVESGYHCSGYPDVVGVFDSLTYCPQQIDTLELTILKSNLNVDLLTSFSPSNPVNKCDGKFSLVLQMYNDQKADVTDLKVQFDSIPGLTLLGSSYHYPLPLGGSFDPVGFNWTMVDPLNFTSIPPADADSLQVGFYFGGGSWGLDANGTLNGILANDGLNLYNFYHMKLDFIVDCDFDVNEELIFEISAVSNCGEPIVLTSSTFIDFVPPISNLNLTMSFADDACDTVGTDDIFITMYNNDTIMYDSLYIDLYCDVDGDGVLDPNVDVYLASQLLSDGLSTNLFPADSATASFNSDSLAPCPGGIYIGQLTDGDTCYCNYEMILDTLRCCECINTPPTNNVVATLHSVTWTGTSNKYLYHITGYPAAIRNITNNSNDPELYIWDMLTNSWAYPSSIGYASNCRHMFFDTAYSLIYATYVESSTPFPHIFDFKLVYPTFDQMGEICDDGDPDCGWFKNACPYCWGYDLTGVDCDSEAQTVQDDPTIGVSEFDFYVNIYPNPADEVINIRADFVIKTIEMIDARGKVIYRENGVELDNSVIKTIDIAPGSYVIKISDGNEQLFYHQIIE